MLSANDGDECKRGDAGRKKFVVHVDILCRIEQFGGPMVHAASSRVLRRARPGPVWHAEAQSGFHWIVFDVPGDAAVVVPVTNSAVEVIFCPEFQTSPVQ